MLFEDLWLFGVGESILLKNFQTIRIENEV